jgi:hypothetical protein
VLGPNEEKNGNPEKKNDRRDDLLVLATAFS